MSQPLKAPFPWYGGKRRLAERIWERLGDPKVYAEPFAGSLACLLARPGGAGQREVVCDTDGGIANFWRAVTADPEAVAHWADYPSIHQDLTARHIWLRAWFAEHSHRLSEDPHFYDAQAAGWWVWGISLWIGGQWCVRAGDGIPYVDPRGGGQGVSAQVRTRDKIPLVNHRGGGVGVSAQVRTRDRIPHVNNRGGGRGVSSQRTTRSDLIEWFRRIQDRLASVVVLNRSWESALTPTILQQTPTQSTNSVGVLLDPPYITRDRNRDIYGSDSDGTSDDVAAASWRWATTPTEVYGDGTPVVPGEIFRIAYCCHEGDFDVPDGWHAVTETLGGIRDSDRRDRRDCVLFSPACVDPPVNFELPLEI